MALTKFDIQALRKCDDIVLRYYNGISTFEAIKRRDSKIPFDADKRHEIVCGHKEEVFSNGLTFGKMLYSAFEITAASFEHIQTVFNLLKVGDELTLFWQAGGRTTETTKQAYLYGDTVFLIVQRGDKKMQFILETSMCPNNSARMCKVGPSSEELPSEALRLKV